MIDWCQKIAVIILCLLTSVGCVSMDATPIANSVISERANLAVAYAQQHYDNAGPGAAYVIAKDGEIIVSGGFGLADLEWNVKNTNQTVFRLGSISKSMTAIALLQLVQSGRVDLDAEIRRYAPALPTQMGVVTLRQLLSHRSGLSEHVWNPDLLPLIWQPVTTEQMIELQKDHPIDFPPGEKYNYVNFNYVLVAHVIEKVTGKSFVDFINQKFEDWSMPNSYYDWHDAIIPYRAEFYDERDGEILNSQEVDLTHVSAAGALMSSADDLAHWAGLLMRHELISPALLTDAWTPAPLPDSTKTKYGLGFNVTPFHGETLIWHTGLTPGSQAAFDLAPEHGLFVAVLSNGFYLPNTGKLVDEMMMIMLTGENRE